MLLCLPLLLLLGGQLSSQDEGTYIFPSPEPFSLDATSAIYCIRLLRENPFLEVKDREGKSRIVKVDTVWSLFLGLDESFPAGHNRRYDIIVNGDPVDWDNSFIEYGGDMLNLHLLFLYRNQYPPEELEYKKNP